MKRRGLECQRRTPEEEYWGCSVQNHCTEQASKLSMSIIIVGVGPAEFDAMVELDGDEVRVSSRGRYAERDIVQFVPFRDYIDRTGNHVLSMARLAKDVLAEIPDQFLLYMRSRGFKPFPAPPPYTPTGHLLQTQI
ncbi:hypothetical protein AB205_0065320 [Aquarana catesbeiana]|uniref:Copine C-terminal domain-containing protein n=1 Tax=Aquarana catesbeiana TaxID=8400 RepID=A0A2G9RDU6_AQUCT|nr:hypothetical protein AB205_0065320 [Aquarana catesbeiana]